MRKISGYTVVEENAFNSGAATYFATEGRLSRSYHSIVTHQEAVDWATRIQKLFADIANSCPTMIYYQNKTFIVKEIEITIQ